MKLGEKWVIHRLMHRWLKAIFGSRDTSEDVGTYVRKLYELVRDQKTALDELREEHEKLRLAFNSFRGRVYAWKRFDTAEEPPVKPPEKPSEPLSLADPRVPLSEVKARLLKPGKPYPHN